MNNPKSTKKSTNAEPTSEPESSWTDEFARICSSIRKNGPTESDNMNRLAQLISHVPPTQLVESLTSLGKKFDLAILEQSNLQSLDQESRFWISFAREVVALEPTQPTENRTLAETRKLATDRIQENAIVEGLVALEQWQDALESCQRILEKNPHCVSTGRNLAKTYRNMNRFDESLAIWTSLLEATPDDPDLINEMGHTFIAVRNYDKALKCFENVIRLRPNDVATRVSLFLAAKKLNNESAMQIVLDQVLLLESVPDGVYEKAVSRLLYQAPPDWVLKLIERWLEVSPENPIAQHYFKSFQANLNEEQNCPDISKEFIETEFDNFADSFEKRLKQLGYRGPKAVDEMLQERFAGKIFQATLDAGCGTGWCGSFLRSNSGRLDGVDLSAAMLQQAQIKRLYDNLYREDLNHFLNDNHSTYDLVVALDTFVYMGKLVELFRKVRNTLTSDGIAIFNLELLEDGNQAEKLQLNGRFAHSISVIEKSIAESGLIPSVFERRVLRIEQGDPVYHVLVIVHHPDQKDSTAIPKQPEFRDKSGIDRIEIYESISAQEPLSGTAYFQLGNAYLAVNRLEDARKCFDQAQKLDNDEASLCNLGNAYAQMGKIENAYKSFCDALEINPDFVPALNNAGRAAFELGNITEAIEFLERAVRLQPDNPKSHTFIGNIYYSQGKLADAIESFQKAIACDPNQPELHLLLGNTLVLDKQLNAAAASYVKAQQLTPQNPFIYDALGKVNQLRGQITEASFCFLQALQLSSGDPTIHSHMIHNMVYDFTVPLSDVVNESRSWADVNLMKVVNPRQPFFQKTKRDKARKRPIRVALVHPDFTRKPVNQILDILAEQGDQQNFSYYCFTANSAARFSEATRDRIHIRFLDFNRFDLVAKQVDQDKIDILIDLGGHSPGHCLSTFQLKAAEVQISWPLDCEPPQIKEIPYVIADKHVLTEANNQCFLESALMLDAPFLTFPIPVELPEPSERISGDQTIQMTCLSDMPHLSAEALALWGQVLMADANTTLFLGNETLGSEPIRRRIHEVFEKMGIPNQRITLRQVLSDQDRLQVWNQSEICLDPLPINSPKDSVLALMMGCPTITLAGEGIQERTTGSLLSHALLGEFVVENKSDYVDHVVKLVNDVRLGSFDRAGIRKRILESTNCDGSGFVLKLQKLLRRIWIEHCG